VRDHPYGTLTIQTAYGPHATPSDRSAYGRGTTDQDVANGNNTLGFHESCHREDYLSYLRNNPLPEFTGRIGMTTDDFRAALEAFHKAINTYFEAMDQYSQAHTDCVGTLGTMCSGDAPLE